MDKQDRYFLVGKRQSRLVWFGVISLIPLAASLVTWLISKPGEQVFLGSISVPLALFSLWALGVRDRYVFTGQHVLQQKFWWSMPPKETSRWPISHCAITLSPMTQLEGEVWLILATTSPSNKTLFKEHLGPLPVTRQLALVLAVNSGIKLFDQYSQFPAKLAIDDDDQPKDMTPTGSQQPADNEMAGRFTSPATHPEVKISGSHWRLIWPVPAFLLLALLLSWVGGMQ